MQVNVRQIYGNWDLGYSLDRHTIRSVPIGPNEFGHMQFDTTRPEAGEALFQLKYRSDFSQVIPIATQIYQSLAGYFPSVGLVVPMPASQSRARQPVAEIAKALAGLMGIPCFENLLIKTKITPTMKNIACRDDKVRCLLDSFAINDQLPEGFHTVLIVDDIYDTGSSLEAATSVLRTYRKIDKIYVTTVTRKK